MGGPYGEQSDDGKRFVLSGSLCRHCDGAQLSGHDPGDGVGHIGEMLISPAIPAFISERAGQAAPFYIGVTGGMGAAGRVIGPYAMGTMYDGGGLTPVAWLAVGVAVLSFLSFAVHARISKDIPLHQDAHDKNTGHLNA